MTDRFYYLESLLKGNNGTVHDNPESTGYSVNNPFSMSTPVFQERLLHAPDVCSNCLGLIREERDRIPVREQKQNRTYPSARYSRNRQTTSVEHVPSECPTDSTTIFCECGCTSSYDRYRSEIVSRERFRELLKQAIKTVEAKGVTLSREHAIKRAMKLGCPSETTFPVYSADEAIGEGIEFGVEMASVQSRASTTAVPAD